MSRQSRLSADDNGDNKLIPEAMYRFPRLYFKAEENPRKPQLGDRLMKDMRPVIASDAVPCRQMIAVEAGREKEEKKENISDHVT